MPSGAKKRKAAKKKKVHDSSTTHSHGENDGGELSSPASQDHHNNQDPFTEREAVEVEKREDNSSENKSISVEKDAHEEEGNIEIDIGSKSKKSHDSSSSSNSSSSDDESHVVEKKVVVLESAPVESVEAIESLPEKITPKVEELEIPPIVDPVKPVDLLLEEVPKVYDDAKNEEKKGLVVEEQPVVFNEVASKDDCTTSSVAVESFSKENGLVKLPSFDEKASSESKDYVASSTSPKGSISEANGEDPANESETIECSDGQPPVAPIPPAVQKTTSWKSCCGIFELFSGS